MTNAQLFVAAHGAIDALKTRRALIIGEIRERQKRLLKLAAGISQKAAVGGPATLEQAAVLTPDELRLVINPTENL